MGLGNAPRRETVISLEARKSFALGLNFKRAATGQPLPLTGATVRMVVAQPAHRGGTVLLTKTAQAVSLAQGMVQVELQAVDLDLAPGEYPFDVTLVSANGYSSPVMKGVVDVRGNVDIDTSGTYAGINPSTQLAVSVEQGDVVEVLVDKVDGMYVIVQTLIAETSAQLDAKVLAAGTAEDNAAAWAGAAADSAAAASDSELAAGQSATAAAGSASSAATSAASAQQAAADAVQVAANSDAAAESAAEALASQQAASASATAASSSATAANTSATNAAAAATSSASSATAAAASASQAEAIVTGDLDPVIAGRVLDPATQTFAAVTTRIQEEAPADHTHVAADITDLDAALEGAGGAGLFRGAWATDAVVWSHDDFAALPAALTTQKSATDATVTASTIADAARPNPPSGSSALRMYIENITNLASLTLSIAALGLTGVTRVEAATASKMNWNGAYLKVLRNGVEVSTSPTPHGWTVGSTTADSDDVVVWRLAGGPGGSWTQASAYITGIKVYAAAEPYMAGEFVTHLGKLWKSDVDNNAGIPGTSGWTEVPLRSSRSINAQTGTAYTPVAADAGKFVTMTNAAASTLTVPPNSSVAFPIGTVIDGAQLGAGQVTLTPGVGVTINGNPGLKIAAQYGTFSLLKVATDTWLAMGRLAT